MNPNEYPQLDKPKKERAKPCPACDGYLLHLKNTHEKKNYWQCSNRPKCLLTLSDKDDAPDYPGYNKRCRCDQGVLVVRVSYKGVFWGCSQYPKCRRTYNNSWYGP